MFIGIVFQGCIAFHHGEIAPNSVNVSTDNFQIINTISGKAARDILGLGGGLKNGLVKEAKNMYAGYNLNANKMITNITIDNKKSVFLEAFILSTQFLSVPML